MTVQKEKGGNILLRIWLLVTFCLGALLGRLSIFRDTSNSDCFKMKPEGWFYWWFTKNILAQVVGRIWVKNVKGLENIPQKGPFLVVPNHSSFIDFMVIMYVLRESGHLVFFIKEKYFEIKLWNKFLIEMHQIKADRRSIVRAKTALASGQPLVLFAEGTRTRSGEVGGAYPGLGAISSLVDVPVIPTGISGAFELWPWNKRFPSFSKRRSVQVSFGEPLRVGNFQSKEEFSTEVMKRVGELKK